MGAASGFTPKSFDDLVTDQSNTWGADLSISPALNPGDPALALFEANAVIATFLESLLQAVINMARLSTSTGGDVDSFTADYGLFRLPATLAEGQVTFSLASPATQQILIPLGTIVQTPGGAIQYQVVADTTQAAWNATLNAYVILAGQSSANVTVQATTAGSSQNVQAGLLTQVGSTLTGVTGVTNSAPIVNGLDEETDAALRTRFVSYLASLSKGTYAAILFAINSVQQGLKVNLIENIGLAGGTQLGFFTAIVDGGGGTLANTLKTSIQSAIEAVRGFTIQYGVIPPVTVTANVVITIAVSAQSTAPNSTIETNVANAISDYIAKLNIGQTLYISQLEHIAINADSNVVAVKESATTINGINADLTVDNFHEALPGTVTVIVASF